MASRRLALAERAAPDAGGEALRALAVALAPHLRELLGRAVDDQQLVDVVAHVPGAERTGSRIRRRVMSACASGELAGAAKVARRWLAPRSSLQAWLQQLGPRAVQTARDEDDDELEQLRASLARPARAGGRRRTG